MKHLIVLVGNIGAGKSTIAKEYQEKGYVVIARDGLRYAIGGGTYIFNLEYEGIIRKLENKMLDYFMEKGVDIVVDTVGVSKEMRKKYILCGKNYGYKTICIELKKLTKKESVNRRMNDPHEQYDREIWEDVWETFDNQYQKPSLDEGFNEMIKL